MKKVLLIGDSIRLSYQPHVAGLLKDEAAVVGPEDNGRFVKFTLWCVRTWVDEFGRPDVIHWNNGIWDVYRQNDDMGEFTPLDEYVRDLARTLVEMKKYCPVVVWATTTPVHARFAFCDNATIDRYNAASAELMAREGIPVDDLHEVVRNGPESFFDEDGLHLSEQGRLACAQAVADAVRRHL
jgi:isoamyl acetate esterase